MKEELQAEFRTELEKKYQMRAFEAFAIYTYWGEKFAAIEKQVTTLDDRRKAAEAEIRRIQDLPDHHSVQNRELMKKLKIDADTYAARIKGVENASKKVFDNSVRWREEALESVEVSEHIAKYKLNTPEQAAKVKADREKVDQAVGEKVEVPALEPVVAGSASEPK